MRVKMKTNISFDAPKEMSKIALLNYLEQIKDFVINLPDIYKFDTNGLFLFIEKVAEQCQNNHRHNAIDYIDGACHELDN